MTRLCLFGSTGTWLWGLTVAGATKQSLGGGQIEADVQLCAVILFSRRAMTDVSECLTSAFEEF